MGEKVESQIDAKVFSLPSPSKYLTGVKTFVKNSPSSLYYDLTDKGLAIVFNHHRYNPKGMISIPDRNGTEFDTLRLKNCLENVNFNVEMYDDLKKNDIKMVLKKVSEMQQFDISCLMVFVMTHGRKGYLQAADEEYPINILWDGLTSSACPKLAGIPKLYFIQACRGDKLDRGYTETDSIGVTPTRSTFTIPSMADFLHMYSTYEDHSSWREVDGSWFIQSLCEVFEEEAEHWDLLQLLTFVNKKVALEYESTTTDPFTNKMKQIPQIKSMLTKLLKFSINLNVH